MLSDTHNRLRIPETASDRPRCMSTQANLCSPLLKKTKLEEDIQQSPHWLMEFLQNNSSAIGFVFEAIFFRMIDIDKANLPINYFSVLQGYTRKYV